MFENIHKNKRDLTAIVCKPDKCASSTNNQCKYERIKLRTKRGLKPEKYFTSYWRRIVLVLKSSCGRIYDTKTLF